MKKPDDVAKAGITALFRNRAESIPGLLNKFTMRIIPLIPGSLIRYIYRRRKKD